jgi:hypothetical protein
MSSVPQSDLGVLPDTSRPKRAARPTAGSPSRARVRSPADVAPAEGSAGAIIASGTRFATVVSQRICAELLTVSDVFTVKTTQDLSTSGAVAVPAGSALVLRVTALDLAEAPEGRISAEAFKLVIGDQDYAISTQVVQLPLEGVKTQTALGVAKKVGLGATIGAALGAIVSKGRAEGVATGAAVGAAIGGVKAATTHGDRCLTAGSPVEIQLSAPASLKVRP